MEKTYQSNRVSCVVLLLVFVLSLTNADGQSKKPGQFKKAAKLKAIYKEQTSFSSEGEISNRVNLPADVLRQLSKYDNGRLSECQQNSDLVKPNAAEHFAASAINLNGDGQQDLIVQAQTPCFMGAHNTTFWLFTRTSQKADAGYQLIFDVAADSLKVLKTSAANFRDIETASHTAVRLYAIKWKFSNQKYTKSDCRLTDENNKTSKIKCDF